MYEKEWVRYFIPYEIEFSPLGEKVVKFLDCFYNGLHHFHPYHMNVGDINWDEDNCIVIRHRGGLHTFDSDLLTVLVVLSHDMGLRIEVNPRTWNYLEIVFHDRPYRPGERPDLQHKHIPRLEDHIASIRKYTEE